MASWLLTVRQLLHSVEPENKPENRTQFDLVGTGMIDIPCSAAFTKGGCSADHSAIGRIKT